MDFSRCGLAGTCGNRTHPAPLSGDSDLHLWYGEELRVHGFDDEGGVADVQQIIETAVRRLVRLLDCRGGGDSVPWTRPTRGRR